MPVDPNQLTGNRFLPGTLPTYDVKVNSSNLTNSDGLNEADEMNLYVPDASSIRRSAMQTSSGSTASRTLTAARWSLG